ncbi:MAG: hypothetical protein ACXWP0_15315 [Ktedonobacterales bacterium]
MIWHPAVARRHSRPAVETAAGARQAIGFATLSRKVRLRGLERGEVAR